MSQNFFYSLATSSCAYYRQLKAGRTHLLELVSKADSGVDEVTTAFMGYLGLLRGLVEAPQGEESKLRSLVSFKWTNSIGGRTPRYS